MKKLSLVLFLGFIGLQVMAQSEKQNAPQTVVAKTVEIACGECQFKMAASKTVKSKGCDLAVRIDGVSYFVDGKSVDDFGDAHAEHGFCNAISKAVVTGEIVNNRFKAKTIQLLPAKK